jgi:hypothetical protein
LGFHGFHLLSRLSANDRERAAGFLPVVRVIFPLYNYTGAKRDFGKVGAKKFEKIFERTQKSPIELSSIGQRMNYYRL